MKILLISILLVSAGFTQTIREPRAMAEWEELSGIAIAWNDFSYSPGSQTPLTKAVRKAEMRTLANIARVALEEGLEVFVLDTVDGSALLDLDSLGVSSPQVHLISYSPGSYDIDVWQRDSGPISVYENSVDSLYFVYWNNATSARLLANYLNITFINNGIESGFYTDGGNYLPDGQGTVFSDAFHLDPPSLPVIRAAYQNNMGISRLFNLPAYRVHIDYYMKLIDEETFIVSDIPYSNYDPGVDYYFEDNADIQQAMDYISQNTLSCYGRPYRFVRVTNAPTINNYSLNLTAFSSDLSYVNSLILNKTVVIPTFDSLLFGQTAGYETFDQEALEIYRQNMPGYRIVGVPAMFFGARGGTIHCISREIGSREPLWVAHQWLPDTIRQTAGDHEILARIQSRTGIQQASLSWSSDTSAGFQTVPMVALVNDTFRAVIPAQNSGTRIYYYMTALSQSGKSVTKPLVAPGGCYSFLVYDEASTLVAGTASLSSGYELLPAYPNPFNPVTNIPFRVGKSGRVQLIIYDLLGRQIRTLVDQVQSTGTYAVRWNGTNRQNVALSSGVYLLQFRYDGGSQTRKLMLLR